MRTVYEFDLFDRTIVKEHIPKRHLNFEEPIEGAKSMDNTADRIYGERVEKPFMVTETSTIGTGFNPADNLAKVGRKQQIVEADVGTRNQKQLLPILTLLTELFSILDS